MLTTRPRVELRKLGRALELVWDAARRWTIAWAIILIVQGLLPAVTVYLTKLLVDGVVAAIAAGGTWPTVKPVIVIAALMAAALLLVNILQSISSWVRVAQAEHTSDHISGLVHAVAVDADLAFYETASFFDQLNRVRADARSRPLALLESVGGLAKNTLTLLAMASLIVPYGWWLPIVLAISTIPAFLVLLRYNRHRHRWFEASTQARRWTNYFDTVLTHSAMAAEVRLFDLGAEFIRRFQDVRTSLRDERIEIERREVIARLLASIFGLVVLAGAMGWMGWRAIRGLVTLGDLALFYQAFNQGQSLLRSLLGSVGQIYSSSLFLDNLFEFLGLQPEVISSEDASTPEDVAGLKVDLQDVTFFYPQSERPALRGINLSIDAGKTIAIVGENGSGKSTLLKLICRFYDPQEGVIRIGGVDARQLDLTALRQSIAVLFQFPVNYHATVSESIQMGDLTVPPDSTRVQEAARVSGFDSVAARLPDGYETLLGKWFVSGEELSGGEWQRLAMARAFYRQAPIVILDEPTSMMDATSEADWFDRLKAFTRDRTTIVVTHRLTVAMRSDIIQVMQDGRIIETGTHDALLERGGWYGSAWARQMSVESDDRPPHGGRINPTVSNP